VLALEVVTAQVAALQSERNALNLAVRQQRASVPLVRALGGGWSDPAQTVQASAQR